MSRIPLPGSWTKAYSAYDVARFLIVFAVRSTDLDGHTPESLRFQWRKCALDVGLDTAEDRVYDMVWSDTVHSLMAVYKDWTLAHVVERNMLERHR
jgi:hypothetical protein